MPTERRERSNLAIFHFGQPTCKIAPGASKLRNNCEQVNEMHYKKGGGGRLNLLKGEVRGRIRVLGKYYARGRGDDATTSERRMLECHFSFDSHEDVDCPNMHSIDRMHRGQKGGGRNVIH